MRERRVVAQATSKDFNMSVVLLSNYRNFQTWYDVETDRWVNGQVQVSVKQGLTCDEAFDLYDKKIKQYGLIER